MLVGSGVDQLFVELRFSQLQAVILLLVVLVVVGFQRKGGSGCEKEVLVLCLFVLGIDPQFIVVCVQVQRLKHLRYHQKFQKREGAQEYFGAVPMGRHFVLL